MTAISRPLACRSVPAQSCPRRRAHCGWCAGAQAAGGQWARVAAWRPGGANQRAQLLDGDRPSLPPLPRPRASATRLGGVRLQSSSAMAGPCRSGAREDTPNVGVEHHMTVPEREHRRCCRRVVPDPGSPGARDTGRHRSAVPFDDRVRRRVQPESTPRYPSRPSHGWLRPAPRPGRPAQATGSAMPARPARRVTGVCWSMTSLTSTVGGRLSATAGRAHGRYHDDGVVHGGVVVERSARGCRLGQTGQPLARTLRARDSPTPSTAWRSSMLAANSFCRPPK